VEALAFKKTTDRKKITAEKAKRDMYFEVVEYAGENTTLADETLNTSTLEQIYRRKRARVKGLDDRIGVLRSILSRDKALISKDIY
jgi:hypothetical protein